MATAQKEKNQLRKNRDFVVQSNDLVEAFYDNDLTATEHKIIRYAASKIKSNPNLFPKVEFSVKEFLQAGGLKSNNYYTKIENIGDTLTRKRIKIKNEKDIGWFPWLSYLKYKDGIISLAFNSEIQGLLLKLEGQFTKYSYQYISDMRSGYSIRLYELLKQYAVIGKRRIDVETLKKMLGVEDKYKGYGQFKQRVISQAKKELDKKGRLTFEFEEIKQGRQVKEIVFYIEVHEKQLTFDDFINDEEQVNFIEQAKGLLEKYQVSIKDEALRGWTKYSLALIEESLAEMKERSDIKYPTAFLNKVLENKYEGHLKQLKTIESENNEIKEKLIAFINKKKNKGIQPDWFIKRDLDKFLKNDYAQAEIDEIWKDNEELLVSTINANS